MRSALYQERDRFYSPIVGVLIELRLRSRKFSSVSEVKINFLVTLHKTRSFCTSIRRNITETQFGRLSCDRNKEVRLN
jgi:hypothetical protein